MILVVLTGVRPEDAAVFAGLQPSTQDRWTMLGRSERSSMIDRVFVYGTLNPYSPHFNEWLVERELGIAEWEEAETKGTRVPSGGAWDYVWFHEDGDPIQGAVLVIGTSDHVLERLDRYEGYDPSYATCHFIRKEVTLSDGTKAWGYECGVTKEEVQAWHRHG